MGKIINVAALFACFAGLLLSSYSIAPIVFLLNAIIPFVALAYWSTSPLGFEEARGPKKLIPDEPSYAILICSLSMGLNWLRAKPLGLAPGSVPSLFTATTMAQIAFVISFVALAALFLRVANTKLYLRYKFAYGILICLPFSMGFSFGANEAFDFSTPSIVSGTVTSKKCSGGKYAFCGVTLGAESASLTTYAIPCSDFSKITEGLPLQISVKSGFFGMPWIFSTTSSPRS